MPLDHAGSSPGAPAAAPLPAAPGSATWEWDLVTGAARFSAAVAELLGTGPEALRPEWGCFRASVLPADRAHVDEVVRSALDHGERWSVRYRLHRAAGPPIEVLERGFIVRRAGSPVRALGLLTTDDPTACGAPPPAAPSELSEHQFHTFIDSLPLLAWTAGPDGWIDFYNRRWFEYTGTTFEQTEGWGWVQVHDPDDLARLLRIWRNAHASGQPWEDEFRLRRGSDGMLRWHLSRAQPYRDASGRVVRWFGTNTDIHDQKVAAEECSRTLAREQRARREAETATRAKDEFLGLLSHELRTPLNAIVGWTQLFRRSASDEARRQKAIDRIEANALLQVQLIEDLLDISRMVTGKLAVELDVATPGDAVRAAVEAARFAATAQGVRLTFTDESAGARVRGSAQRLQQIAGNLVSNAIKFTPRGRSIDVSVRRAGASVEIVVRDEGEGIAPEFLPHLFERFRQADSSSTRRHGGLGLGLFIVRELTQLLGGEVVAASGGPGRGSTFTVRLPVPSEEEMLSPPAALPAPEAPGEAVSLAGIKVLGVDDEPSARDVLGELLLACGATVTLAGSVHEALRAFELDPPDVVVSDIAMPELDGYDLIDKLRELGARTGRHTPVIALTAYASLQDRERALHAGFDRHLAKPLDAVRLSRLVSDLARRRAAPAS